MAARVHALAGRRKFVKEIQSPSLQSGNFLAACEQWVPNNVHGLRKPAFRLLFCRVAVEGLYVGQNSLPPLE